MSRAARPGRRRWRRGARLWALVGVVLLGGSASSVSLILWSPEVAFPQRPLSPAHHPADCRACHVGWDERTDGCAAAGCHDERALRQQLAADPAAPLHEQPGGPGCLACHGIHRAPAARHVGYAHETSQWRCSDCHSAPLLPFLLAHLAAPACEACHETGRWDALGPVDHRPLAKTPCQVCHMPTAPAGIHPPDSGSCGGCHVTERWAPEDYPHVLLIAFGVHRAACVRCHTERYTSYRCETCHEHELERETRRHRGIMARHPELTVAQCAACHPQGTEARGALTDVNALPAPWSELVRSRFPMVRRVELRRRGGASVIRIGLGSRRVELELRDPDGQLIRVVTRLAPEPLPAVIEDAVALRYDEIEPRSLTHVWRQDAPGYYILVFATGRTRHRWTLDEQGRMIPPPE